MKISKPLAEFTDGELSLLVWLGTFGVGGDRKKALGDRYGKVQDLVEKEASTGIYSPGGSVADLERLKKAVTSTYSEAAEDLIKAIEKEAKS